MEIAQTLQQFTIIIKTEIIYKKIFQMPSIDTWVGYILGSYNWGLEVQRF